MFRRLLRKIWLNREIVILISMFVTLLGVGIFCVSIKPTVVANDYDMDDIVTTVDTTSSTQTSSPVETTVVTTTTSIETTTTLLTTTTPVTTTTPFVTTTIPETTVVTTTTTFTAPLYDNMTLLGNLRITGYVATGNKTASGQWPYVGGVAMARSYGLPWGTKIYIEGLGYYTLNDCGCKYGVVDVFCSTIDECYKLTSYANVYVVND